MGVEKQYYCNVCMRKIAEMIAPPHNPKDPNHIIDNCAACGTRTYLTPIITLTDK
jgi:hypothetical protein